MWNSQRQVACPLPPCRLLQGCSKHRAKGTIACGQPVNVAPLGRNFSCWHSCPVWPEYRVRVRCRGLYCRSAARIALAHARPHLVFEYTPRLRQGGRRRRHVSLFIMYVDGVRAPRPFPLRSPDLGDGGAAAAVPLSQEPRGRSPIVPRGRRPGQPSVNAGPGCGKVASDHPGWLAARPTERQSEPGCDRARAFVRLKRTRGQGPRANERPAPPRTRKPSGAKPREVEAV